MGKWSIKTYAKILLDGIVKIKVRENKMSSSTHFVDWAPVDGCSWYWLRNAMHAGACALFTLTRTHLQFVVEQYFAQAYRENKSNHTQQMLMYICRWCITGTFITLYFDCGIKSDDVSLLTPMSVWNSQNGLAVGGTVRLRVKDADLRLFRFFEITHINGVNSGMGSIEILGTGALVEEVRYNNIRLRISNIWTSIIVNHDVSQWETVCI